MCFVYVVEGKKAELRRVRTLHWPKQPQRGNKQKQNPRKARQRLQRETYYKCCSKTKWLVCRGGVTLAFAFGKESSGHRRRHASIGIRLAVGVVDPLHVGAAPCRVANTPKHPHSCSKTTGIFFYVSRHVYPRLLWRRASQQIQNAGSKGGRRNLKRVLG